MQRWMMVLVLLLAVGPARAQELAGRYRLTGVREAAGEIVLRPDGSFEFGFVYGALDQVARGRWTRGGDSVTLVSEPGPPPRMLLGAWATYVDREYVAEAPALVVRVESAGYGTLWRGMAVTAEYTGGARREGRTGRNGSVALPFVRGAAVRRVRVADPQGRVPAADFPVDPKARTLAINLMPGNLVRPAFERLTLRVRGASLVVAAEGGAEMTFVR